MTNDEIADRNSAQLHFTADALKRLPRASALPGSRSDGGMLPRDTGALLQQILETENELRKEIAQLASDLAHEKQLREYFESTLRKIAELVVNGAKHANDEATRQ